MGVLMDKVEQMINTILGCGFAIVFLGYSWYVYLVTKKYLAAMRGDIPGRKVNDQSSAKRRTPNEKT